MGNYWGGNVLYREESESAVNGVEENIYGEEIGFGKRNLINAGLGEIANKVAKGTKLSLPEVRYLATEVSLPLLAKLVELVDFSAERQTVRLRPVLYLPLAELLETKSEEGALAEAYESIRRIDSDFTYEGPIYLALDRWSGDFSLSRIAETVVNVCEVNATKLKLLPLGPSTVELTQLLESVQRDDGGVVDLNYLLRIFESIGVTTIEGGADLDIHLQAARAGFTVAVSQELSSEFALYAALHDESSSENSVPHNRFSEEFFQELEIIRGPLWETGRMTTWFPWTPPIPDETDGKTVPLGVQVLRAISIARLLLPDIQYIRAPLTSLGIKLAHVGLSFGANDLGFAAIDRPTADALGIAKLSDTEQILKSHGRALRVVG